MANLKDLIVNGVSRFIGKVYSTGGFVGDLEGIASNALKVNGHTVNVDVPSDAKFTDTWRGIQNNLTSDSTTDSLSAKQGKALKTLVDGKASSSDLESVKKSVSDGKSSIASAITNKGVATAADATFATMVNNIDTMYTNACNTGYKNGVIDADNRANANSVNYKTGYNNGYSDGSATGYKVASGQFVQQATSAGWRKITINTGLSSVDGCLVHGHYESNGYYGMGGSRDYTISGGTITANVSFIAGCNHTIYWLAYGH